jgi:hypothetical protein
MLDTAVQFPPVIGHRRAGVRGRASVDTARAKRLYRVTGSNQSLSPSCLYRFGRRRSFLILVELEPCGSSSPRVVPEPSTLSLFGLGLLSLGAMKRRRRDDWKRA